MLLQICHHTFPNYAVHQRTDIGIAQLGLGLSLKLRIGQLDRNHCGDTLPAVLAGDAVALLEDAVLFAVGIECPSQCSLKAGFMGAAFCGVNVICKGQ